MKPEGSYIKYRIDLGSTLNRTFKIFALSPLVFLGLGAIFTIPAIMLLAVMPDSDSGWYILLYWGLGYICQGAISVAVDQALQNEKANMGKEAAFTVAYEALPYEEVTIGKSVAISFKRMPALLMLSFCCAVCIIFGILLFVLPAILVFITFSVATPACVIEKLGPIKSLNRSEELTKGSRLKILGLYLVLGLIFFIFIFLADASVSRINLFFFNMTSSLPFARVLAHMAWIIISSIMITIIYHDLRNIRKGAPIAALADIFD